MKWGGLCRITCGKKSHVAGMFLDGYRLKERAMRIDSRIYRLVGVAASVWALSACSMATSIQRDALDYNAGVANYNDQMLMYTILRARDEAPGQSGWG